jgi:hypothetical protein
MHMLAVVVPPGFIFVEQLHERDGLGYFYEVTHEGTALTEEQRRHGTFLEEGRDFNVRRTDGRRLRRFTIVNEGGRPVFYTRSGVRAYGEQFRYWWHR